MAVSDRNAYEELCVYARKHELRVRLHTIGDGYRYRIGRVSIVGRDGDERGGQLVKPNQTLHEPSAKLLDFLRSTPA